MCVHHTYTYTRREGIRREGGEGVGAREGGRGGGKEGERS